MAQQPEYVSVPKAAEMLGCTDVWVLKLIGKGELQGFRLNGRAWAVSLASVKKNLRDYLTREPSQVGRKRSRIG